MDTIILNKLVTEEEWNQKLLGYGGVLGESEE